MEASTSRGTIWIDREVKALVAIWGEGNIQDELDGAVRNQSIYKKIAKGMRNQGYDRDWKQCRDKIKNLKTKYREVKDNNGETGRQRISCKFYQELDIVLGHRPASVPSSLLESAMNVPAEESEEIDGNRTPK